MEKTPGKGAWKEKRMSVKRANGMCFLPLLCGVLLILATMQLPAADSASGAPAYPPGTIITIAGAGTNGYAEGGPLVSTGPFAAYGLLFDASGNLYISDFGNSVIRKVDSAGTIRTIAGNGTNGFSGDGGPATSAQLNAPYSVALDSRGNLYIADYDNNRIRKVDAMGIISTVAGTGIPGFSGDGGPAAAAQIHRPSSIAIDSKDNLYIADWSNSRIRKVDTSGIISTFAGGGGFGYAGDGGPAASAKLRYPTCVAIDSTDNLYITDNSNYRIRKVDTSGIISTVAGAGAPGFSGDGGPALSALIYDPWTPVFDAAGNMYFADSLNNRVRKIDTSGTISTVAGTGIRGFSGDGGPATLAKMAEPLCVTLDSTGNLYIASYRNFCIRKVIR